MELTGKTAIVTGAGQGIGRGIALVLAERGASVVLNGRTPAKLAAVKKEIDAAGGRCVVAAGDVGSRSDVASVVEAALGAFGGIDILVNNAQARTPDVSVLGATDADLELTFRSGALGTLYAMQACHPHMKARGGGAIVNFGSSVAVSGDTGFAAYTMEWGPDGIRVNVICPAAMSPSAQEFAERSPERFRRVLRGIPAGRFGDPVTDIGRAVAALVSEDLSYLTGATLMLDGGRTLIS
jgi:NAD(P)-dependent dehydrogenase (short-subunit alcohol dehydrogenase family)